MLQYLKCLTTKVPVLATNATGLSTGFTLASYAATDTYSYAGGLTGLVTGAGYAYTFASIGYVLGYSLLVLVLSPPYLLDIDMDLRNCNLVNWFFVQKLDKGLALVMLLVLISLLRVL